MSTNHAARLAEYLGTRPHLTTAEATVTERPSLSLTDDTPYLYLTLRHEYEGGHRREDFAPNALMVPHTSYGYESGLIDMSNHARLEEDFPFLVATEYALWLVPALCEDVDADTFEAVLDIIDALIDYPLYDKDDYSTRHREAFMEDWTTFLDDNDLPLDTPMPEPVRNGAHVTDETPSGYGFTFNEEAILPLLTA